MFRHIFMATFKSDSADLKTDALKTFRDMYKEIPQAVDPKINLSKGWIGSANQLILTADFKSKEDFDIYAKHPKHLELIEKAQNIYFDPTSFVVAQFELN